MPSKKFKYDQLDFLLNEVVDKSEAIILLPDCFIEKIFIEKFLAKLNIKMIKKSSLELSLDWIENNILSYDMFSDVEGYVFYDLDKLKKKSLEMLSEVDFAVSQKKIFFTTSASINKSLLKLPLFDSLNIFELMAPKFWETRVYIETFASHYKMPLPNDVVSYISQACEQTPENIFEAVSLLYSFSSDGKGVDLIMAKKTLKVGHIDNFALADMFNQKSMKAFYRSLLMVDNDFQVFRSFFVFIQGHISKVIDPSYLDKKPKHSKYDQGIKGASRKWNQDELISLMRLFTELEILAKSKSISLRDKIRLQYLKN